MASSTSLDAASVFIERHHPKQHIHEEITFPKILSPRSCHQSSVAALVHDIASNRHWIQQELHRHSALLLRGFSVRTAQDFAAVSSAFGWEPMKYRGPAVRHEVLSGIYTANEGPLDTEIWLHHEMAQFRTFPSKIIFFCEIEPAKAGETPVVLSHRAAEQIQKQFPAFMKKLETHGAVFTPSFSSQGEQSSVIGKGWHTLFETTDQAEAEIRAEDWFGARIEWQLDKSAKIIIGPLQVTRSFREDGRKVWFCNVAGINDKSAVILYGDGSKLPADVLNECYRVLEGLVVEIPWQQGDVLVLDNLAVLHGRRAAEPPRRILVSMYK